MKKLNLFKKLGLCALSAALCASAFAFTACDNDKTDNADNEQKQEQTGGENENQGGNQGEQEQPAAFSLTAAEWDAAMALDFDYSFVENVTFGAGTMSIEQTVVGNSIKQVVTSNGRASESYFEKDGENYYQYGKKYSESGEKWAKNIISKTNFDSVNEGLVGYKGKFGNFTFNGTDTYTCESMTSVVSLSETTVQTILMKNIKIKFNADKKVEKVDCVMYSGDKETDNSSVISMTFDYSEKTITLPQVSE